MRSIALYRLLVVISISVVLHLLQMLQTMNLMELTERIKSLKMLDLAMTGAAATCHHRSKVVTFYLLYLYYICQLPNMNQ
jgi:hypothetical protein